MQNQKFLSWKYLVECDKVFTNRTNTKYYLKYFPKTHDFRIFTYSEPICDCRSVRFHQTTCWQCKGQWQGRQQDWHSTGLLAVVTHSNVTAKVHTVQQRFILETLLWCSLLCSNLCPKHFTHIAFNPHNIDAAMTPVCATWDKQAECPSHSSRHATGRTRCYPTLWGEQGLVSPKAGNCHTFFFFPAPNQSRSTTP